MQLEDFIKKGVDPDKKKKRRPRSTRNDRNYSPTFMSFENDSKKGLHGVSPIHRDEIPKTIAMLETYLGMNLQSNLVGSAGKKEFSGDIDVAISLTRDEIPAFIEKLKQCPIVEDVKQSHLVMSKVKIPNFEDDSDLPRSGFVQVDFIPSNDVNWTKSYYCSPDENSSKYKGAFRNVALGILASMVGNEPSTDTIEDGRPEYINRYKLSPDLGLVKVKREPVPNPKGGYFKKHKDTVIDGPWNNMEQIAKLLKLGSSRNINTFESIITAVKENYDKDFVTEYKRRLTEDATINKFGVPDELGEDTLELSLIPTLNESRMYRSKSSLRKHHIRHFADHAFLDIIALWILYNSKKYYKDATKYAYKTAMYHKFKHYRQSGTDLYMCLHVLSEKPDNLIDTSRHSRILEKLDFDGDLIDKYLRYMAYDNLEPIRVRMTLQKIERMLLIDDSNFKFVRRSAQNWQKIPERVKQNCN